ncbi:metallophosphoesterase [Marinobacter santoriniensis NKSG1]|uniref:Metallophosphoesterase n=1 Tax=Marinobacter santoriniensis NKSG1 TaxID=1288826 RepID=M7DFK5_9GAMM|nr:metallophosphatase domain-containing protein [Marinobacter santoriniensis]EMP56432.1 metallophosphoesterase [Marinobacter santoriniensis NKSG1]
MRIVCISDTHSRHEEIEHVPEGDVLVHAGDCLAYGSLSNLQDFDAWLGTLPHRHKIFVAGNHDTCFEDEPGLARKTVTNATYLEDSGVEIEGFKFWGSPWTPRFFDWAFNAKRGPQLFEKWQKIPLDTDVLITHGPPKGILDTVTTRDGKQQVGCNDLLRRLSELKSLKAHIFGHIHGGYGTEVQGSSRKIRFVNASICTEQYEASNHPIIFDIE